MPANQARNLEDSFKENLQIAIFEYSMIYHHFSANY